MFRSAVRSDRDRRPGEALADPDHRLDRSAAPRLGSQHPSARSADPGVPSNPCAPVRRCHPHAVAAAVLRDASDESGCSCEEVGHGGARMSMRSLRPRRPRRVPRRRRTLGRRARRLRHIGRGLAPARAFIQRHAQSSIAARGHEHCPLGEARSPLRAPSARRDPAGTPVSNPIAGPPRHRSCAGRTIQRASVGRRRSQPLGAAVISGTQRRSGKPSVSPRGDPQVAPQRQSAPARKPSRSDVGLEISA